MRKELSALLDGEIEQHEMPALWSALKANVELRHGWGEYRLIGDALRGEAKLSADITARVMERLADEPIVFAPRPGRQHSSWQRSLLAMAASLAGVAVVGWLALTQQSPLPEQTLVARLDQPTPAATPHRVSREMARAPGMQEYLLAHQANAPGLYLPGGAQHIRTVSAVDRGQ
jgi:sigma-E factor negative regulatory protein RseA